VRGICEKPRIKCADCPNRRFLPVTDEVIRWHLSGRDAEGLPFVAGVYPLLQDETCFFLAVDFDTAGWREDAAALLEACQRLNLPAALERSRSGRGAHVWFSFEEAIPAALGTQAILRANADGAGTPETLLPDAPTGTGSESVSLDDKFLVFRVGPNSMLLSLTPGAQPQPLLHSKSETVNGAISPDGHWIAFEGTDSGPREVYLRPFPAVETGRSQISTDGGEDPLWSRSGRELFFANRASGGKIMVVSVQSGQAVGNVQALFASEPYRRTIADYGGLQFDVSSDGKRLLMLRDSAAPAGAAALSLTIVTHWLDEMKTRVK
jgi:hypothetical protein